MEKKKYLEDTIKFVDDLCELQDDMRAQIAPLLNGKYMEAIRKAILEIDEKIILDMEISNRGYFMVNEDTSKTFMFDEKPILEFGRVSVKFKTIGEEIELSIKLNVKKLY